MSHTACCDRISSAQPPHEIVERALRDSMFRLTRGVERPSARYHETAIVVPERQGMVEPQLLR